MIWHWFWREWRSPSLLIVWLSLTLAMACSLALGNIGAKLEQVLSRQSREFLAADRVLRSAHPIEADWLQQAKSMGLQVSQQVSFMTMTYANEQPVLASVKATDEGYPLYGELKTQPNDLKPSVGRVLISPRLQSLLKVNIGDAIDVGDASLKISGQLIEEPDAGFNPFEIAPRILIHLADLPETGAIQPGSRITYRYMFAGSSQAINQFSAFIENKLQPDQRWISISDSNTNLGKSMQRAEHFLLLSAFLTLLLSAAAVAVAMGHYCRSRHDLIAVLKTLGAGRVILARLIIGQWLLLLALAALTGMMIGYLFEYALLQALKSILPQQLPTSGAKPIFSSLLVLVVISLLVSLRPYVQLLSTQPLRVLRRDTISTRWPLKYYLPITLLLVTVMLAMLVGFNAMWWSLLAAMITLALVLGLIGWCSLMILRRMALRHLAERLAVNRLLRQPGITISQLAAFSLSFMLLALLFSLRGGLLERWQQQLPESSPNYYMLNVAQEQIPTIQQFLQQHQIVASPFYPIVLTRLTEINDQPVRQVVKPQDPGYEAINRELNVTWLDNLPAHNRIIEGHWPTTSGNVSIEQGVAQRLNIKLGDKLTFTTDTDKFSAIVSSIRSVDWESLQLNFYFIFPQDILADQPHRWTSSFRYNDAQPAVLAQFNRQFPTVSLIDVNTILTQLSQIVGQVSKAIEVMVILVIACGFLLLMAQVQVGMQQRFQELKVYRILGAGNGLLRRTLWGEFALLGAISGLTAVVAAEVALWLLQKQLFDFEWQPNWLMWLILPIISTLLLAAYGGLLSGRLLKRNIMAYRHDV